MRKKLIVANWKMNLNPHQASLLVHRLDQKITSADDVTVVLCPPYIDLYPLSKDLPAKFKLGSQNLYPVDEGPYTGEVSAAMLQGLVQYAIIGHSERRRHIGEKDALIAQKMAAAIRHSIRPILCVGETLLEREHGAARKVVTDQLTAGLAEITATEVSHIAVTYEPVWAISSGDGRGHFATPDEVAPQIAAIRGIVSELYGPGAGQELQVLYGGSVNPDDCRAYLAMDGVDGLLVGGASLNYEQFSSIIEVAQDFKSN